MYLFHVISEASYQVHKYKMSFLMKNTALFKDSDKTFDI